MSENIDDDCSEDEKKIKVVKLRKKVVKVVAHTDKNLNKSKDNFVESPNSLANQDVNRGYSYGNKDRGARPSSLSSERDNTSQQQGNRGYFNRNYVHNRDNRGGGYSYGNKDRSVRPFSLSGEKNNTGSQQQSNRGGHFNRNYAYNRDNRGYSYGNKDRGLRPSSLSGEKDNTGVQQQGNRGYFNRNNSNSSGSQTFRRVIRTKVISTVAISPSDSDSKGLNRKLGEKKKQQQENQKGYKRKKEELESQTIEQKVFDQLQKKKKENLANPIPKSIDIMGTITVAELARKMNLKSSDLIAKLMTLGVMATINEKIDSDTATILVEEYGSRVNVVSIYDETVIESEEDDESKRVAKPPIITIMGHVDHGKTKLLSVLQNIDINQKEFGGITQHIGAYTINYNDHEITFLDTPGHEAFTMMRSRGAQVTDIVVLVVSAVDGVMPQTVEAINHAKDADVPIIVAINKIDLPDSNQDRVKHQLSEYDLVPEDWGGNTIFVAISALKNIGITELLDMIILQAEVMSLKANPTKRAIGRVLDAKIDLGRGIVCSVIVEDGTLSIGDSFVGGVYHGKVRALINERGVSVNSVGPAKAISVLGFSSIPQAGDPFQVTKTEKEAKLISSKRQDLKRYEDAKNVKKVTVSNLYDSIKDGALRELKIILKADVQGSVEALRHSLERLTNNEIRVKVIHSSVGAITETDISFASASEAIIIGFHVRPTTKAQLLADQEKVEIRKYNIIYDAINDIKSVLEGMLEPDIEQKFIGFAEVRAVFNISKVGIVAGCYVSQGCIKRDAVTNIMREGFQVHSGKISSLKRAKEDVKEVNAQYECGIIIDNYFDVREGDIIEAFEIKKVKRRFES
ncbi:translation initiation factor IF-2 [Borrelia coriaceae]|uniref:translation initiation factor IF-2 n=1 Tax=Borrelia coriaceae TaxID=144 RepID=UPI00046D34C2|nr:translation initiation factor IF-2 [Borrelia coriaceae]UPA16645.1 translation initiation factor IF-2 [Borrelia coriaceae]